MDLNDGDVAFVITVFQEVDQLEWCLHNLRKVYHTAAVLVTNDGDKENEEAYRNICIRYAAEFEPGDHLMNIKNGGAWLHRVLTLFMSKPKRWLVKMDPDTLIHHKIDQVDQGLDLQGDFGGCASDRSYEIVYGCCYLLSWPVARTLFEKQVFLDDHLRSNTEYANAPSSQLPSDLLCEDETMNKMVDRLGGTRGYCRSITRHPDPNGDHRWAVTHRHKGATIKEVITVPDSYLCFVINAFNEVHQLEWCLYHLRMNYATSDVIIITDGDDHPHYDILAEADNYNATLIRGPRRKLIQYGGEWLHRWHSSFLEVSKAAYLIKIDPDTQIINRFGEMPRSDAFGHYRRVDLAVAGETRKSYIHGGCKGRRREVVEKIVRDQLFLRDGYRSNSFFSFPGNPTVLCEDVLDFEVLDKAGFTIAPWPEVRPNIHYAQWPGMRLCSVHGFKGRSLDPGSSCLPAE